MKNFIMFLLTISMSLMIVIADETQLSTNIDPSYHKVDGDVSIFSEFKTYQNSCYDPYSYPRLLQDMTIDGISPSAIVVVRKPTNIYLGEKKGVNYYNYFYYGFYGQFTDGKFIVTDDNVSIMSVSSGFNEEVYSKNNRFDVSINDYNGKIHEFYLSGFQTDSGLYKNKSLKHNRQVFNFDVSQSGKFIYQYGGLSYDYIIFKPSDEQIFFYPDNRPFLMGVLQPLGEQLESKEPLVVIPQMVQLAVVFLVGLLTLLIILKVSLKVLKMFLPI